MELDPALLANFKTLRLHPLIQRRGLMYGVASAANQQMPEEERSHDVVHAEMLALARKQFIEALVEKGLQPDEAEHVVQYVDSQNTEASKLMFDLVGSLASIARSAPLRASLPVHMQSSQHFGTGPRWGVGMEELLGERTDSYITMMRMLDPKNAVDDRKVLGEVKRNDVILGYIGSNATENAARMRDVLNTLKKEFELPGLYISLRPGKPERGVVRDAQVTLETETLHAMLTAYEQQPEKFEAAFKSVGRPGRAVG